MSDIKQDRRKIVTDQKRAILAEARVKGLEARRRLSQERAQLKKDEKVAKKRRRITGHIEQLLRDYVNVGTDKKTDFTLDSSAINRLIHSVQVE